jgi:hypothetical protein
MHLYVACRANGSAIAYGDAEFFQAVRFSENRCGQRSRLVTAFGRLQDRKDELFRHCPILPERLAVGVRRGSV